MRHLLYLGTLLATVLAVLALSMPVLSPYAGVIGLMWLGCLVLAIAEGSR